jgi:hypothetical protein
VSGSDQSSAMIIRDHLIGVAKDFVQCELA